jgi:hypothetical protein
MAPRAPASSNGSRAADFAGFNPLVGHPFGMIQRRRIRDVRSRTSTLQASLRRYDKAPYRTRTALLFDQCFAMGSSS